MMQIEGWFFNVNAIELDKNMESGLRNLYALFLKLRVP